MKFVMLVLDGAGDRGKNTPLNMASKPNMDSIAKMGRVGLLDIGYKKGADSDVGYLNLLGCYDRNEYPGRGYLAALGVGLRPGPDDVCIRGNFATLDYKGNLRDRRAGRDETELEYFAEILDGMEIDGVRFTVRKCSGHRVVIVMKGENLSHRIVPNDPKKTGVPLPQVKAMEGHAKFTASVLNKFSLRVNKILSKEPAQKKRRVPANIILIRNVGIRREGEDFWKNFKLKGLCVAGITIAKGVSRFVGLDVVDVPGTTGRENTDIRAKMDATIKGLKDHDFVFLHINGTDILSHDRKRSQKREFIRKIDKEFGRVVKRFPIEENCYILACDHRTVSLSRGFWPGYEHTIDPVPIAFCGPGVKPDQRVRWDEGSGRYGSFFLNRDELMGFVLKQIRK